MDREHVGPFDLLLCFLSVYVLVVLSIEAVLPLSPQARLVLAHVDTGICVLFLIEFVVRLTRTKEKLAYLKWGWVDLVSSVPVLPVLRIGRMVRVVRVFRVLRSVRSAKSIGSVLLANRAKGTLASALLVSVLLVTASSVAILHTEVDPSGNIKTAEDAVWWSLVTITTVGYGDKFPVTSEGRIVAAFLMTAGVGLFAVFTGCVASWFMRAGQQQDASLDLRREMAALREELSQIRGVAARQGDTSINS
jgi:voltage-gated potassium channel